MEGGTTSGVIGRARRHCGAKGIEEEGGTVVQDVHGNMGTNAIRRKIG